MSWDVFGPSMFAYCSRRAVHRDVASTLQGFSSPEAINPSPLSSGIPNWRHPLIDLFRSSRALSEIVVGSVSQLIIGA